jgi:hypothetical protein
MIEENQLQLAITIITKRRIVISSHPFSSGEKKKPQ